MDGVPGLIKTMSTINQDSVYSVRVTAKLQQDNTTVVTGMPPGRVISS